ncbi:PaaI family thioesterase [Ornithinimicrobium faecis]|uniref:Medium/long-chain acyl-CoA thioesterase YigI n=1 Tax=Ornithinimicrobium faecis TaxID=2934158 RepID=A0ABY4YQS4_9MICO|nr:PaaI family thioesterase [Ornithinimicrobium sp. HY1793]USQ79121.1 PaaI family thioesterase [Ornithinimicrobium sp. HY1793]
MEPPDDPLLFAQGVLAAQPFSELIGARITEFGSGVATIEVPIRDDLCQQFGFVHGGVWAYAADNAITFAAGSVLGPKVLTAGVSIDYLRPAREGVLTVTAQVVHSSRRLAVCRADLRVAGDSRLCAVAHGRVNVADPGRRDESADKSPKPA